MKAVSFGEILRQNPIPTDDPALLKAWKLLERNVSPGRDFHRLDQLLSLVAQWEVQKEFFGLGFDEINFLFLEDDELQVSFLGEEVSCSAQAFMMHLKKVSDLYNRQPELP